MVSTSLPAAQLFAPALWEWKFFTAWVKEMLIKNLDPGQLLELQKGTYWYMAGVAQLVRAPGCGSGGRRFDPGHSPHFPV